MNKQLDERFWPKTIRRMAAAIRRAGLEPRVQPGQDGGWEVFVAGEHIRASAFFARKNGKTRYDHGRLLIDGKEHPAAETMEDLRDIWDEHENGIVTDPLVPLPGPGGRVIPRNIRLTGDRLEAAGRDPGYAFDGKRWVVGVDFPGGGLRIFWERGPNKMWCMADRKPLVLIVDGEDRSAEAGRSIEKAMSVLAASHPEVSSGIVTRKPSPAARDNGVETRRMVVLRELIPPARALCSSWVVRSPGPGTTCRHWGAAPRTMTETPFARPGTGRGGQVPACRPRVIPAPARPGTGTIPRTGPGRPQNLPHQQSDTSFARDQQITGAIHRAASSRH